MMREILFRGKTTKEKEWVYGDLLHDGYDYDVAIWEQEYKLVTEISPETVGQFTGLTDKNGKKIFEDDIGKSIDGVFLVRWSEEKRAFVLDFYNYPKEELYIEEMWDDAEVIGNIHDNPEFLRGEEDG